MKGSIINEIPEKIFDRKLISGLSFTSFREHSIAWSKSPKYKVRIPNKIDKQIAYLAGVIMGDGNIAITQRYITKYPRLVLRIFNSSKNYLEYLNKCFDESFRIKGNISKKKNQNCYKLSINKKLVILYFLKMFDMSAGKKVKLKLPTVARNKKLFRYLVAGLFDTDGYFSNTFGMMMSGTNYNFLKEISILLEDYYGIHSRKLWYGEMITDTGLKTRSQFQIRSKDIRKFLNTIPLKHFRYGPVV